MSMSNGVTGGIFATLADLQASKPRVDTRLQLIERNNAVYIVQQSGYEILPGDVQLSNGLIGKLQFGRVVDANQFGLGEVYIYVNPTGDDSNNGMYTTTPLKTVNAAFELLKSWGKYFKGRFIIQLSAGTYMAESAVMDKVIFNERLRIQGPDVSNGTPTAVLDGAGATSPFGLDFIGALVRLSDIKVQNYVDIGEDIGVRARDMSDVYAVNVHSENCDFAGISAASLCRLRLEHGDHSNNLQFGVRVFGNTSFTIGGTAVGVSASNNVQANFIAQDSSQGTIVDFTSVGSQSGVNLRNQCSARLSNCDITAASIAGVYVQRQSRWNNDSNAFNGNTANWIHETYSTEVEYYSGAIAEQRRKVDNIKVTHTGDTNLTLIKTIDTLIANSFVEATKKLRVRVYFTADGAGGTKAVGVRFNGNNMSTAADIQAGNSVNGVFEVEVFPTTASAQGVNSHLSRGSSSLVTMGWFDRTEDMTVDKDVRIYVQLTSASDSITINAVESFLLG